MNSCNQRPSRTKRAGLLRVLIIKTSSLGDVIHTLPALTDAGAQQDTRFDWVVEESFAEVPGWHRSVDRVIPVALRRWRKTPLQTWRSGEWQAFKQTLGQCRYDRIIDAQGLLKSAWLTRYAQGPRYGLDKHSAREPLASRFYDHPISVAREQHAVERVRQLLATALEYEVPQHPADYQIDRSLLPDNPYEGNYLVFLHGTTWPTKHWPEAYWRELGLHACEAGLRVLIPWGNATEKQRADNIAEISDRIVVLPRLNLGTLAAILAQAQAVVSVDTGLAHLCAALNTPNITLYGPTRPKLVGTYGRHQIHLQAEQQPGPDADNGAMAKLTPERVWRQLTELLQA